MDWRFLQVASCSIIIEPLNLIRHLNYYHRTAVITFHILLMTMIPIVRLDIDSSDGNTSGNPIQIDSEVLLDKSKPPGYILEHTSTMVSKPLRPDNLTFSHLKNKQTSARIAAARSLSLIWFSVPNTDVGESLVAITTSWSLNGSSKAEASTITIVNESLYAFLY